MFAWKLPWHSKQVNLFSKRRGVGGGALFKDVVGESCKKLILILWRSIFLNIDKIVINIIDWKWWFSDLNATPTCLSPISIQHSYCQLLTVVPISTYIGKYIT